MKQTIELKHVGPRAHVRSLFEELIGRLESKLDHFPKDTVSLHALFEENGTHKLYRVSLACHVPGQTVAAHEERREAGAAIREAFAELERQLEKQKAVLRGKHLRQRARRKKQGASSERDVVESSASGPSSDTLNMPEDAGPSGRRKEKS